MHKKNLLPQIITEAKVVRRLTTFSKITKYLEFMQERRNLEGV